jgi:phosphatidylinositol alpha-mannosyltransferase
VVLLEAMAAGAAVVASRIDGYANVAREDREGILATPGDPVALRDALRRTLDDADLRARLVVAGRLRAEELSMARLAEAYADLYEEAVKHH